jgi:hypothetical protein
MSGWLFPAMPRGRVAWLRLFVYGFVFVDMFIQRPWVQLHGQLPGDLYHPLFLGRLLPLPVPGPVFVDVVRVLLLVFAGIAAMNRLPRLAGGAVFFLYLEWMLIAFSYGKVDHDRFAFLVALAVLPTVGAVRWRDRTPDQSAGWALRFVQIAVVATYFLAAWAKLRYGGIEWLNGATLMRALLRRGTPMADPLLEHPDLLRYAQHAIVAFELLSPLMLVRGWIGRGMLAVAFAFHTVTYLTIGIHFSPHLVAMLSFLPLEFLGALVPARTGRTVREMRPEFAPGMEAGG